MSNSHELKAMKHIRESLAEIDREAAKRLMPLNVVKDSDVPQDAEIDAKLAGLKAETHIGDQYATIARFAKHEGRKFELAAQEGGRIHALLKERLRETDSDVYEIDVDPDEDLALFSYFQFPLIETSKLQMQEHAIAHDFQHLMELTWFCHGPLLGAPCGFCNPCKYARDEGLGRRVPEPTPARLLAAVAWGFPTAAVAYVKSGGRYWNGPRLKRA